MPRLRITQSTVGEDRYRVDLEFEADGGPRQTTTATFDFQMTEQDQADLRWYLEDFLQYPQDPAPTIADRVVGRMAEIGVNLFRSVFHASDNARDLWANLREQLDDTHVEVITSVEAATAIPWELIRDPKTNTPLALRAAVFVRAHPQVAQRPQLPRTKSGPIRILLVICRPRAGDDVPYRSVASRLIKGGLGEEVQATFQLDVLRPPTFEQLALVLRRAKADRKPYHVVHFDGHGMYAEGAGSGNVTQFLQRLSPVVFSGLRGGKHGYLLFENPRNEDNVEPIDGPTLGKLLVETRVSVLVLNACRSAHAEAPTEPERAQADATANPHAQVGAFGSLAQEVMDAGVAGVVAMRYNVYVVTAAKFVRYLYATLVRGQTLGAAVTMGRKQLDADPSRTIAYDPCPLQDWCVPVVYEAAPIQLFPQKKFPRKKAEGQTKEIQAGASAASYGLPDKNLPRPPDTGFFGRDETLLAIDRAFDTQSVVLLYAFAGSGKTSTAAEFARWYWLTGGLGNSDRAVLFTSFEAKKTLSGVLCAIGDAFGARIRYRDRNGVEKPWNAIKDLDERRDAVLQVLAQIPVLWIWDNVESVAGFPKGTLSDWSDAEQRELVDFLRDARPPTTRAKFLLTSRRDEHDWLGDLPRLIEVPPMPMQERVQLTRALADKRGHRITDVADWRPLLRFTDGNPLTITVLVRQALRDGLTTKQQIDDFVSKLRAGTAKFTDEASEGRTGSLGASLSYGFEHAFSEAERKQLALLHLFQGFVEVVALMLMGDPEADWCLPAVRGLTREAGIALLDRAAEVGLLTPLGGGDYTIHPAVPWFFKSRFDTYYAGYAQGTPDDQSGGDGLRAECPMRAFVEAMGVLGDTHHDQYVRGNFDWICKLNAEEANLLHARRLARQKGWWRSVISTMRGLRALYEYTGRWVELKGLVDEIVPDFVDPTTDGPRPGLEYEWEFATDFRIHYTMRDLAKAERLERIRVDWNLRRAEEVVNRYLGRADLPSAPDDSEAQGTEHRMSLTGELRAFRDRLEAALTSLTPADRGAIRNLGATLHQLGVIQRNRKEPECVVSFEGALDLAVRIGDRAAAACCALNLGKTYLNVPAIRDLDQAEIWIRRCPELHDRRDLVNERECYATLGHIALIRFEEARAAEEPVSQLLDHLNAAMGYFQEALELTHADKVDYQAILHNSIGGIYLYIGDIDSAMTHYRYSISLYETSDNIYYAAQTRFNVALALGLSGRFSDAREYARAALAGFASCDDTAAADVQKTQKLIEQIDKDIADQNG